MNPTRAALRQIAASFGYDPDCVVAVYLDQYEARVKYRIMNPNGTFTLQEDGFLIGDPPPAPAVAVDPSTPVPVGAGLFCGVGSLTAGP